MAFAFSRFRGKRAKGGEGTGSHHSGRLSHGYRWDNIALIVIPSPMPPRLVLTRAASRAGVGHSRDISRSNDNRRAWEAVGQQALAVGLSHLGLPVCALQSPSQPP